MGFKEQMAADAAVFFNDDEFAEQVTYNGISIIAIPDIGASSQKGNFITGDGMSDRATFAIKISDVTDPKSGDEIDCHGKIWTVSYIAEADETMSVVMCTAGESSFSR